MGKRVVRRDRSASDPDRVHPGVQRAGSCCPQMRRESAADQRDRIDVGRVRGQTAEMPSCRRDRVSCAGMRVQAQLVEDHDLSRVQRRNQVRLNPLGDEGAVAGAVDHHGRSDPGRPQRRSAGHVRPVIAGDRRHQPLATRCPTVGAGLVEEDEVRREQRRPRCLPGRPLVGGDQVLFLRVRSRRATARHTVLQPTTRCWSAVSHAGNSPIVTSGTASMRSRSRRSCAGVRRCGRPPHLARGATEAVSCGRRVQSSMASTRTENRWAPSAMAPPSATTAITRHHPLTEVRRRGAGQAAIVSRMCRGGTRLGFCSKRALLACVCWAALLDATSVLADTPVWKSVTCEAMWVWESAAFESSAAWVAVETGLALSGCCRHLTGPPASR